MTTEYKAIRIGVNGRDSVVVMAHDGYVRKTGVLSDDGTKLFWDGGLPTKTRVRAWRMARGYLWHSSIDAAVAAMAEQTRIVVDGVAVVYQGNRTYRLTVVATGEDVGKIVGNRKRALRAAHEASVEIQARPVLTDAEQISAWIAEDAVR